MLAGKLCSLSCHQDPLALQGPLLQIIRLLDNGVFVFSSQSYCDSILLKAGGEYLLQGQLSRQWSM